MSKNIGRNIRKNLIGKYSQEPLAHAIESATGLFKTTSERAIQNTAKATVDLIGNRIVDVVTKSYDGRITKVSK